MKVGIITYHRPHNYGALLQAYSLKTYIKNMGHQAEIVDYWPLYHSSAYGVLNKFQKLKCISKIKMMILTVLNIFRINKKRDNFEKFCKYYLGLHLKPLYLHKDSLKELQYDIVVYGSDQIWRKQDYPLYKGFDEVYFGEYVPAKKKITYAVSMGVVDINKQDQQFIKNKINNFDSISIREVGLLKIIAELTEKKVEHVLDPVFLLKKTEWNKLTHYENVNSNYLLLFNLLCDKEAIKLADEIAKFYGFCVIEIPGTDVNFLQWGVRYKQTESPLGFLSLIKNASFVVSTSFHGVAFSLIFEKQFYATGLKNNSDRVETLLTILGISQRYLQNSNEIDYEDRIDYDRVSILLQHQIEKSSKYLQKALTL